MSEIILDRITLTVNPNESQFHLARRAFILIAQYSGFPPSERIAFADTYVPLSLNTPGFKISWTDESDPSPKDSSNVKIGEFNKVKGQQVGFVLTPEQKSYLVEKRKELIRTGIIPMTILSDEYQLYGYSGQFGTNLWESYTNNGNRNGNGNGSISTNIENVEIPEKLRTALRLLETEAFNFGTRYVNDARVRQDYLKQACGPGAPVCVTLGVFIGGVIGALATDYAFDEVWE